MVVIPGRERHRVAVQIAQQLLPRQLGVVFVKDKDLVPVIFIEGVLVVGDTVDVLYRYLSYTYRVLPTPGAP